MDQVLQLDRELFRLINSIWQNQLFDLLMPVIRNSITWVPFYVFLLAYSLLNFKKNVGWWIFFGVSTAIICDFISSDIIKDNIFRIRPCHDLSFAVLRVVYCPQSSSFTSSHATNHFGLSMFLFITLRPYFKKWSYLLFLWAFIIIYAQVYVGVHYPLDVLAGGLIGLVFGYLSGISFKKHYGLQ